MAPTIPMSTTKGTYQPLAQTPMDSTKERPAVPSSVMTTTTTPPPGACRCGSLQCTEDEHAHTMHDECHKRRRRRFLHFAAAGLALLALLAVFAHACGMETMMGFVADSASASDGGLFARQSNGSSSSSGSGQGVFVKNKRALLEIWERERKEAN